MAGQAERISCNAAPDPRRHGGVHSGACVPCPVQRYPRRARDFDKAQFKRFVKLVKEARGRATVIPFVLGDVGEHISIKDKRFNAECVDPSFSLADLGDFSRKQTEAFIELLDGLRMAFVAKGNHEVTVEKKGDFNPHRFLCQELGVEDGRTKGVWPCNALDGGYSGLIRLRFKRDREVQVVKVFYHHGWFGGSNGNIANKLTRTLYERPVDLVVVGHGHNPQQVQVTKRQPNQQWTELEDRQALGVQCASWKRGDGKDYTTYSEIKGYTSKLCGPTVIEVRPDTKTCTAFFGPAALERLK